MIASRIASWAAAALVVLTVQARAVVPLVAQEEAAYLIGAVDTSGCTFFRNGLWYDAARAARHLREKYSLVTASGAIGTGEAFIDKVATKSAFTGLAYEVDCPEHARLTLATWLTDLLARHRASGTPR